VPDPAAGVAVGRDGVSGGNVGVHADDAGVPAGGGDAVDAGVGGLARR
jgi:hypothetical protein